LKLAAIRYRVYLERAGKIGTPYVMQASRFYGPDEPWREYLDMGKPRPAPAPAKRYTCEKCGLRKPRGEMEDFGDRPLCVSCKLAIKRGERIAKPVEELLSERRQERGTEAAS